MKLLKKIFAQRTITDKFAFGITHVVLIVMFMFEITFVLPRYYEAYTPMYYLHLGAASFVTLQAFSNMYYMILVDTSIRCPGLDLPYSLKSGWSYCYECRVNAPPRSHHCPVCDVCVLKRDHHCIFTGNCVGFYNHRYFIVFIMYLWLGCVYAMLFSREFYGEVLGDYGFILAFKCLFPMLVWATGYISAYQFGILIVMTINILAMLLISLLVGFQVYLISRGQTQFESKSKIRDHHLGFMDNWRSVLGKSWYLTWLSCFVPSQIPGDGKEFKRMKSGFYIDDDHLKI